MTPLNVTLVVAPIVLGASLFFFGKKAVTKIVGLGLLATGTILSIFL